jgi:hypothetical protein
MGATDFAWDEAKRDGNLAKHGIDFIDGSEMWQRSVSIRRTSNGRLSNPGTGRTRHLRFAGCDLEGSSRSCLIRTAQPSRRSLLSLFQ